MPSPARPSSLNQTPSCGRPSAASTARTSSGYSGLRRASTSSTLRAASTPGTGGVVPLDLPDLLGVAPLEHLGIRRELDARPGRDAARAQDHELPLRDREGRVVEDGPARKRRGREREEREPLLVVDVDVREDRVGTRGDGDASLAETLQQRALDDDEPPGDVPELEVGERCGQGPLRCA